MKKLLVAATPSMRHAFRCERTVVDLTEADLTRVSAVVATVGEAAAGILEPVKATAFGLPLILLDDGAKMPDALFTDVTAVISGKPYDAEYNGRQIDAAAQKYEDEFLPPFFSLLEDYVEQGYRQFDCPGHQGGTFFRRHPAGREFAEYFGENLFRADLCNADVSMGDLLIHQGAALEAQKRAAKVFHADKTYFVLNGTSSSNKVVLNALLAPIDLVLFDRNNHKSVHQGALIQAGATPVYLETARNPYGLIGGIDEHCFDEGYIRSLIREVAPERADLPRPFRCAVIQLGTYDGTISNARQIVDKIGHLCDYILFDSAWVGYEQFIPMMKDCSPMLLELGPDDPGIFVTQSVHKQMAGFSQCSQIHKKDRHIKGQERYCPHRRVNNAFMLQASTSPFYPLFAALDVNAKMHSGESGRRLWADCVRVGIEARKDLLRSCSLIRPFIPERVDGRPWDEWPTDQIAADRRFWAFDPKDNWHGFSGYGKDQYFVDPCKLLMTTPGIDRATGGYEDFGVPASVLAYFLRENGIVPEKADLNSILFLLTPAEDRAKMQHLIAQIARFEALLKKDAPLEAVLPSLARRYHERYRGWSIRRLCQELHDFYRSHNLSTLQREMFRKEHFPKMAMKPQEAHYEFMRDNVEMIELRQARGRIAVEGALPYPPGILCVVPGEIWDGPVLDYFLALEELSNSFPGFESELQGVYMVKQPDGTRHVNGYVLKEDRRRELGL
jgi:ornithine decarboxylase